MSINISISGGESKKLLTSGKYCEEDVVVTAEGGFTPPDGDGWLDPEEVYRTTRPSGWLPMPTPNDYECYCLGQIFPNLKSWFVVSVKFTGTCTLEFGNLVNGEFIAKESHNLTHNTYFSTTLSYDDYGDELPNGNRQYLARIYGTNINEISFKRESSNPVTPRPNIVDICCGLYVTLKAGDYNNDRSGLPSLQYLRFVGNGCPKFLSGAFVGGCNSLISVTIPNEIPYSNSYGFMAYAFYGCQSLKAISMDVWREITSASAAFYRTSMRVVHTNATPTSMNKLFEQSSLLLFNKDTINSQNATDMSYLFNQCSTVASVTDLDITSATTFTNAFYRCFNLQRLKFAGETAVGGYTIDLSLTTLGHDALVEMIESLPIATNPATITITSTPGASALTDAEIAVATAKNWTITR